MSATYHIDAARYERIRSQGYSFPVPEMIVIPDYKVGDSVFHLMAGKRSFCERCQREAESLKAENPAALEMEKLVHYVC